MNDFTVHPVHFLIPAPLIVVGGLFTLWDAMAWVGWVIVVLAVVLVAWLIWRATKDHEITLLEKQMDARDKEMEFQKMILSATPEDRAILGWSSPVKDMELRINKTAVEGNEFSMGFSKPPLAPWVMQSFALGVLAGKGLTMRAWAPKSEGKLLSDPEWRKVMDWLKMPLPSDKTITFVQPINPNNNQDGQELNELGKQMMEQMSYDTALARLYRK